MQAEQAHGALGVLQRRREGGLSLARWNAVLDQGCRDADRVQPLANLRPLQVQREDMVAAAREDEHGRSRVLFRRRRIDRDRRDRDIPGPDHRSAGDEVVRCGRRVVLLADVALLSRRRSRPEVDRSGLSPEKQGCGQECHGAAGSEGGMPQANARAVRESIPFVPRARRQRRDHSSERR